MQKQVVYQSLGRLCTNPLGELAPSCTQYGGGGLLYRDYFAAKNFVGEKFCHHWEFRSSNCLVPASWSQAFSSAQKAVNPLYRGLLYRQRNTQEPTVLLKKLDTVDPMCPKMG